MAGEGGVALDAGVIKAAALHADGDDVGGAAIVFAAGLWIEIQAADFGSNAIHAGYPMVSNSS